MNIKMGSLSGFLFHLLIALLLSETVVANNDGCGFCAGGTLQNPDTMVAISSTEKVHTCLAWQQIASLTDDLTDDACLFVSPFFEAICGCDTAPIYEQCDLCGSPLLTFAEPTKGLIIPFSGGKYILCHTIYSAVQSGAVPPDDCRILQGIADFCGGCVKNTNQGLEFLEPTDSRIDVPVEAPVSDESIGLTEEPTIGEFVGVITSLPSSTPTGAPSAGPTVTHSSTPTSSPTEVPSGSPTVTHSMAPTAQLSSSPSVTASSSPTSTPTTAPSESPTMMFEPTATLLVATNVAEAATIKPSISPTMKPSTSPSNTPEFELLTSEPTSWTCDLCPGGTLEDPSRLTSLISMDDKTVTKTCGALLWDARSGRNEIEPAACYFLKPFFGATCGCSTFTPFRTSNNEPESRSDTYDECKLCDKPNDAFQNPFKALRIPGSFRTKITCGGVFLGGINGATSESECRALATIDQHCGGCGMQNSEFYGKVEPPKECIDCQGENESSMYIYKDFGTSGTTFQKAFSAPFHCIDKNKQSDCTNFLHPELESCVLAPVTSFDELLRIQAVVPPGKAAYTAVHKDPLVLRTEARECYTTHEYHGIEGVEVQVSRSRTPNGKRCALENWRQGLAYGYGDEYQSQQNQFNITATVVSEPCESMKSGWTNYKTGTDVPSSLWKTGKLNYCNLGPVQEVGAVWAVEPEGLNYGDLRDVSANWPLPGAVYKCCKTLYSCFDEQ